MARSWSTTTPPAARLASPSTCWAPARAAWNATAVACERSCNERSTGTRQPDERAGHEHERERQRGDDCRTAVASGPAFTATPAHGSDRSTRSTTADQPARRRGDRGEAVAARRARHRHGHPAAGHPLARLNGDVRTIGTRRPVGEHVRRGTLRRRDRCTAVALQRCGLRRRRPPPSAPASGCRPVVRGTAPAGPGRASPGTSPPGRARRPHPDHAAPRRRFARCARSPRHRFARCARSPRHRFARCARSQRHPAFDRQLGMDRHPARRTTQDPRRVAR